MAILALFLLWPVAELFLFIQAGLHFGFINTLLYFCASGVLGFLLLQGQGLSTLDLARRAMQDGKVPADTVFDTLCLYLAGILLILPGFISDGMALALFLPPVRAVLRRHLQVLGPAGFGHKPPREDIIEGEFTRLDDPATTLGHAENDNGREGRHE